MVRIGIVEDDQIYIDILKQYLERYSKESKTIFNITTFYDGGEIVTDYSAEFDIILMDIEMKHMNGMKAAEKIRELDEEVVIIFITNMPQYVMEGYKVDALDYVLKPLTYFALSQRIERALSRMKRRYRDYITITFKEGLQKIDISKIKYIEVRNHESIIHTLDGNFQINESLKNLEAMIDSDAFFKINKSYLVHLEYVDAVKAYDVVSGDDILQVSRARKKDFLDALNNHMNEVRK